MHAPSSSGRTEPPGEPEILTGPAGDPSPRRKPGPAMVVASALVAAAVGAGSVFAFVHFTGDDRDPSPAPGVSGAPQNPGPDQAADGPAESGDPAVSDPDNVTSGADGAEGSDGSDGSGDGNGGNDGNRESNGSGTDPAESGSDSGSDSGSGDRTDSSSSGGGDDVKAPPLEDGAVDPRADGEPGFVPPKGPIGGY
ncbi:hypothetical protein ACFFMN_33385 [Planobispora siamensis]|uniref:Uncharacterized protein n=1 Tax=Planobispora siamensis TaxID=936338 RepID=A0A8J3WJZ5_9ACTN|nr:hypothetical protein [Planobispora siamensis]GIH92060.1 hypothetical protein Psi01_26900 [Planobispora siamensis]